jgi:hypothetical protein
MVSCIDHPEDVRPFPVWFRAMCVLLCIAGVVWAAGVWP